MGCIFLHTEKLEEKVTELEKKVTELEKKEPKVTYETTTDKPKLAGAIIFAAFMALFITGIVLHWHWGWLTAIGIIGVSASFSALDGI
jgi:hypothetical protein